MFDLEKAIARWRQQMSRAGLRNTECLDELEGHLREDFEHSIHSGLKPDTAFADAVQRLGHGDVLAGEFKKSQRSLRRQWLNRGICLGIGMFGLALAIGYFVMLPLALAADAAYAKWLGFAPLRLDRAVYIVFAARLMVGLTLCFETPVIVLTLLRTGAIDLHSLSKGRKYVLIVNLFAAAITAGRGMVPQISLFILLQGTYELTIALGRFGTKAKKRSTHSLLSE